MGTCGIVPLWLLSESRRFNQTFHPILNLFLPPFFFEALFICLDYEKVFPESGSSLLPCRYCIKKKIEGGAKNEHLESKREEDISPLS
jgi:hypothetical protein